MATLAEIDAAIRNAHRAGRRKDIQRLAVERQKILDSGVSQPFGELKPASPQAEYDMLPDWQKPFAATGDVLRLLSSGVTLGGIDKVRPAFSGRTEEQERALTQAALERSGLAGGVAEATGMSMLPGNLFAKAEQGVSQGMGLLKKLVSKGLIGSAEGGIIGGLDALGHDEDVVGGIQRGMVAGPLGRLAGGLVTSGTRRIANIGAKKPRIPKVTMTGGRPSVKSPTGAPKFISAEQAADIAKKSMQHADWSKSMRDARGTSRAGSGTSIDASIRSEANKILKGKRKNMYSEDQRDTLTKIAEGTFGRNLATRFGVLSPLNRGGLGGRSLELGIGGAGAGIYFDNPAVAAALASVPVAGLTGSVIANALTKRAGKKFLDDIVTGGRKVVSDPAVEAVAPDLSRFIQNYLIAHARP